MPDGPSGNEREEVGYRDTLQLEHSRLHLKLIHNVVEHTYND